MGRSKNRESKHNEENATVGSQYFNTMILRKTNQEECICQEGIEEHSPANPVAGASTTCKYFGEEERHNNSDELVSRVGSEVNQLGLIGDA